MEKFRFGIDMGGTFIKMGVVNGAHKVIDLKSINSSGQPSVRHLAKQISDLAFPLLKKYQIKHVGVGVAGDIDFHAGVIRISPNLGWKKVPLTKILSAAIQRKVIIDNDANVAAWGIYKTQIPQHMKNVIVITLGTGVGGGIILNGELYRGATGSAGEVGHMTMDPQGPLCNCGDRGCLETYAGGIHIVRSCLTQLRAGAASSLKKIFKSNSQLITPYEISKAALAGDKLSKSIWSHVGNTLGIAVGNLIYAFNPDAIYFTGGVAQAGKLFLNPLRKTLATRPFHAPISGCKLAIAKEAAHIGVVGAALL